MKSKRVWIYVFVILMLLSQSWGVQSAIATSKAKSVGTKEPTTTSVVKEGRPSQTEEKPEIFPQLGHTFSVKSVVFSPDGRFALSGSADSTLRLWEVAMGKEMRSFTGHTNAVSSVVFSPDGRFALSGSDDKTLRLWNVATGKEIRRFAGHTNSVKSVVFSPDGRFALSGNMDKTLRLWNVATGKEIRSFAGHTLTVRSVAFSPDGRFALSGSDDRTLRLWNVATGKEIRSFAGYKGYFTSVVFSPDGRFALSGSGDNTLSLWNVATGKEIRSFTGHTNAVSSVAFSPDGRFALSGSDDKTLRLWNVDTGKEIRRFAGHTDEVKSVVFSPDGRFALSGSWDKTLRLWNVDTGKEIRRFAGHTLFVNSAAFSPDGRLALSGSMDKTLRLWNVAMGKEIRSFAGHTGRVSSVAFSPDGRFALSGSGDSTTRIWDINTDGEIAQLIGFTDGEWIAITPEGYYNSSLNGHKNLNIRMGMKVYGIDQFYDVFYRPDIVMAKLKGEDIKPLITLTIDDTIKNPPPEVDFTSVPSDSTIPTVKVCYQAKNSGGGIGEVRLFHNGKLIQSDGFYKDVAKTAGKIQLASLDSKSIRKDMRSIVIKSTVDISPIASKAKGDIFKDCVVVDAVPGENEVSVSAFNKDNTVQSYMKTTGFKANIKAEDSHLYMLLVGTDQYNDQSVNLKYAVKDARDIKDKLLSQSATLYKPENIHAVVLTDKEATKANIQSQISLLAKKIKPADSFVLFVAGHGVLLQNQYFMLTQDFDGNISDNSMISSNEIVEASKQIKSLSQLFIFDTCHAGGVDYIVSGLYDARMSVLAKKMGLHIYASANDKQVAMDGYKGNGLFTYTLLSGLNNKKEADKNNDGAVSLVELGGYSKQATADISKEIGHSQTPLIINFGKDQPVYKLQNVR